MRVRDLWKFPAAFGIGWAVGGLTMIAWASSNILATFGPLEDG